MNRFLVLVTILLSVNTFAVTKKTKNATGKTAGAAATTLESTNAASRSGAVQAPAGAPAQSAAAVESTGSSNASTATVNVARPSESSITGTLDIRPSWGSKAGEVHTENWVDIGYRTGQFHIMYEQDFNTNIYSPGSATSGMDLTLMHGMFRLKAADVWTSPSKDLSLSVEMRPFVPTYAVERDKGMITIVRNYLKFAAKVSDSVTLSLWEVVIPHIYSRAGNDITGVVSANRSFENRVYLMADWNITDKWALSVPLWLSSNKYRDFAGAANSGNWEQSVWFYPELDYVLTPNYTLGISWYNNDSFFNKTLSDSNFQQAFETGVTQVVFRATL